ncbi:hypothetical protein RJ55_06830 [Drechmeria coniospora]|nr:hypothetical protein RJ55_06830 [Drechmeria coniospora]
MAVDSISLESLGNSLLALPGTSVSTASKGSSPLTEKVTAILSTSYSDVEFREALSLLDARGVENSAKSRRRVRLDLHKEVLDSNSSIIDEFGHIAEQLCRIKATLDKLNEGYDDMREGVIVAHAATMPALGEAKAHLDARSQVETKRKILESFKEHFVLTGEEIAALTSKSEPVDDQFFDTLLKAKRICQDCEILLGFEGQKLGSDLMAQSSKNIHLGFQKLYTWVQREFKTLNLENLQMNPSIRKALRVLAERPSLFQSCLDFFAEARERILSDAFHVALTGTTTLGVEEPSAKPIDLAAHDLLRYVGDMFAWIHSATVSERETLEVLFIAEGEELARGLKSGRDAEIWRLVADEDESDNEFNALRALGDLVDRDVAGASRTLRQRVEQVIRSNEDIISAYKLSMLINFYQITFQKLLGMDSNLVECIRSLEEEALRQFRSLVRDHIATLQGEFQHTPPDLGPPAFLHDALKQLKAIMKTFESSLSSNDSREGDFEKVLAEAFEPFMSGCDNMAESMQLPDGAIFLVNCKLTAVKCLGVADFTNRRADQLKDSIRTETAKLIEDQHRFFCEGSGLSPLLGHNDETSKEQLNKDTILKASRRLDEFLPSALMDAMERLRYLQDSSLAHEVTELAAKRFCEDFKGLEQELERVDRDSENPGEPGLRSVFPRTTTEIQVLLS